MAFCIPHRLLCLALPIDSSDTIYPLELLCGEIGKRLPNRHDLALPGIDSSDTNYREQLPLELLCGEIGKRLSSRLDLVRFRSVCKQWRSSLPPPTRFPFLVPRPPGAHPRFKVFDSLPYFIIETNIYSIEIGSKRSMLEKVVVAFKGLDQATKFEAQSYYPYLPAVGSDRDRWFDTSLDPEHRLSFITKAYELRLLLPRVTDPLGIRVEGKWDSLDAADFDVKKIVLVSSSSCNANYAPLSNLSAFALLRNEPRLALLRLAGSQDPSKNWNWDTDFCSSDVDFEDIVDYKGQLCTLASCGRVHLMDSNSLQMTEIAGPLTYYEACVWHWRRLFVDSGDLYLVVEASHDHQEFGVDFVFDDHRVLVFKLDFQLHQWLEVVDYVSNEHISTR